MHELLAAFFSHALYDLTKARLGGWLSRNSLTRINAEHMPVLLEHRSHFGSLLHSALTSNEEVLMLSIMSLHTVMAIRGMMDNNQLRLRRLRVLTLHPGTDTAVSSALGSHLKEDPHKKPQQIQEAWASWKALEGRTPSVEVRGYKSLPTLQATIVVGQWMTVELLPYAAQTVQRPGLFLSVVEQPRTFRTLWDSVERLWNESAAS